MLKTFEVKKIEKVFLFHSYDILAADFPTASSSKTFVDVYAVGKSVDAMKISVTGCQ